jgi:DNA-binding LacI/PurR family transcriptional regulator
MDELGYRPHALARGLASKRSRILSLLFSAPERGLGTTELEFVTSAAEAARENGYHLVLWSSEIHNLHELRQLIRQGLADGVIVMEVRLHDDRVDLLRENGFPFTMIGRCADTAGIAYVDIDFEKTTHEAVNYLAGLGHRHIAFLNHSQAEFDAGYGPAVRAHADFQNAIQAAGIEGVTRLCRATPAAGDVALRELLAECPDLTALIAMNDRALPGVIQAIAAQGWRIPDDFSLVAMVSSARVAEMVMPPLTTMTAPGGELGRLSVELLIQHLETQEQPALQQLLPCRLDVRGCSGPGRRNPRTSG